MYRRLFSEQQEGMRQQQRGQGIIMSGSQVVMKEQSLTRMLIPFESYLVSLQSILIWEKPCLSVAALALVNVLFWIVVSYSHRFYSFLAVMCICMFVYKTWVYQVWPEIRVPLTDEEDVEEWTPVHPKVLSVPEISRYITHANVVVRNYYEWLKQLRAEKPGTFCLFMSGMFSLLAVIGQVISGTSLAYLLVMSIMTVPGLIIRVLPHAPYHWWESLKETVTSSLLPDPAEKSPRPQNDNDLDEFLPETDNPETEAALNMPFEPSAESLELDDSLVVKEIGMGSLLADDDENELLPETSNMEMPKHEDDSGDENETEFAPRGPLPALNGSETSSNNHSNEMQFVPTHFNDSDTDEEEAFARGLHFADVREDTPDRTTTTAASAASALVSALSNLPLSQTIVGSVGSILGSVPRLPVRMTTSDRSATSATSDADLTDFEIVSESDIHSGD